MAFELGNLHPRWSSQGKKGGVYMAKGKGSDRKSQAPAPDGAEATLRGLAGKDRDSFIWIREDGAICFGNECAVIKPTPEGKLGLTVRPDQCGQETGRVLLDFLVATAGKGVVIEIPSELQPIGKPK